MRTIQVTLYSAAELKAAHPAGFKKALQWWERTTYDDPAWAKEYREALQGIHHAIGDDPPDVTGARRCMAWAESHVFGPLRIGWQGARRWELAKYGPAYRPECIKPCPWSGTYIDDAILEHVAELAQSGTSPRRWLRSIEQFVDDAWNEEVAWQASEESFLDGADANGYEFDASGTLQ